MQVLDETNISQFDNYKAIALGNFDGIHLGHQSLLKTVVNLAKENNLKSSVFTFKQHTMEILDPKKKPNLIMTMRKKTEVFRQFNLDYAIFFNFNKDFSHLSPEDYVKEILLKKLKMKIVVIGNNYRFGYKGLGDAEILYKYSKKYNFILNVIEPVKINGKVISSSYIRELIKSGEIEAANKYLGRAFSLEGIIIEGKKIGRQIGFPTANLKINDNIIVPKVGVYITRIKVFNQCYLGVTNVGFNPTFGNNSISIESYIIDFDNNIYNKFIEVEFIKRIRDEVKFKDIESLRNQLIKDVAYAKNFKKILQD